jgi:hypothetical protein
MNVTHNPYWLARLVCLIFSAGLLLSDSSAFGVELEQLPLLSESTPEDMSEGRNPYAMNSQEEFKLENKLVEPQMIFRAQSPTFTTPGMVDPNAAAQLPYPNLQQPTVINPYGNTAPGFDPFQAQQGTIMAPGGAYGQQIDPYSGQMMNPNVSGLNGAQPYRFGWTNRWNFNYIFGADVNDKATGTNNGELKVFELDWMLDYVTQGPSGWVWTWTPEFNYRELQGPGFPDMPPNLYRFGSAFRLDSPEVGPWHFQASFTPAIATDFQSSIKSDAFQFDGLLALYYRASPQWLFAVGAMYWDRVDDIVLPYGGLIWTPNQFVEMRLIFPRPRIDIFLGAPNGHAIWLYAGGEYHVESYAMVVDSTAVRDQVQSTDWRAFAGLRKDNGWLASFVEGGYVFNREYEFKQSTPAFDVDDGFFVRAGLRY